MGPAEMDIPAGSSKWSWVAGRIEGGQPMADPALGLSLPLQIFLRDHWPGLKLTDPSLRRSGIPSPRIVGNHVLGSRPDEIVVDVPGG